MSTWSMEVKILITLLLLWPLVVVVDCFSFRYSYVLEKISRKPFHWVAIFIRVLVGCTYLLLFNVGYRLDLAPIVDYQIFTYILIYFVVYFGVIMFAYVVLLILYTRYL
jgi:hypothetical protein